MSAPPAPSERRKTPGGSRPRRPDRPGGPPPAQERYTRPLYTSGGIGAATAAAVGLATLTTLTLAGWIAAPPSAFSDDIVDVFRIAIRMWLVGHHVELATSDGRVGLFPMGLLVLPGLLLYHSGRRLARVCALPRLRHSFQAALALAGPYAAIAGTLALVGRDDAVQPSMPQALVTGFLLAFTAGGLGALRQLLKDREIPWRRLLDLMPLRLRALLTGLFTASTVLALTGTLLFFAGLAAGFGEAVETTRELRPGVVGGILLFVVQLLYLPNAIVFGVSYAVGPGFAFGADTVVAPTGVALGPLPALPMLAALPDSGPAPVLSLVTLAAPFLAGALGGRRTLRGAPVPVNEAAPLWGFVCGAVTGALWAGLAALAGGPLGADRLAEIGASPWQVGMVTALEVGVSAAIAAWVVNWRYLRQTAGAEPADRRGAASPPRGGRGSAPAARRPSRPTRERAPRVRLPRPQWGAGRGRADEDDSEDLYGITYEAETPPPVPDDEEARR
ncbi:cell division protein PerM [Thermobifida cellulosilytica]|uniref:cell division protein PerM n=1 Tax=Thermobifida cellulosilytica TaxID=144786 RepID=UPI000A057364|nr:DUF6350 family protein [Thermobifida cellulosilytica]